MSSYIEMWVCPKPSSSGPDVSLRAYMKMNGCDLKAIFGYAVVSIYGNLEVSKKKIITT